MSIMMDDLEKSKAKPKRIFLNYVDLYHGKHIAKFLSNSVVGSTLEEVEEDDDLKSVDSGFIPPKKEGCFEVVGTVRDGTDYKKPDFIKEIIQLAWIAGPEDYRLNKLYRLLEPGTRLPAAEYPFAMKLILVCIATRDTCIFAVGSLEIIFNNKDQLYEQLSECDIIVYDITDDPDQIDEAVWAASELHSDLDRMDKPKMFILISNILTWAKSRPLDPEDPEIPFTEDDYRRRKPHPNYKEHISAEKVILKVGKTNKAKLLSYVVCSGLTYGLGENIFHFLFKDAWHNTDQLMVFGKGDNVVPTIHINDLAGVIQNIADSRPKVRYLVAKDDASNTLQDIVTTVSLNLGSGKSKHITREEAYLNRNISQSAFDMLLVNLRMDAVNVKENMRISWVSEAGLVENIQSVIKEYKETRKLLPLRACILGPPASGKTTVVKQLCEHYKLHHIQVKTVLDESLDSLEQMTNRATEEDTEEDDGHAQEAQELLEAINEGKDPATGHLEEMYITRFIRDKLHMMPCQNQGFVLDGFPKTMSNSQDLFRSEEEEDIGDDNRLPSYDHSIMPEVVICLEAGDDFLKQRIMDLPESEVAATHNTEEGLQRRLEIYKANNQEDVTVLNYFDEIEIHPVKIDVSKDTSPMMKNTVDQIIKLMGEPRNYGPTKEELEQKRRTEEDDRLKHEEQETEERNKKEAEEAELRSRRQEDWNARLSEVRREEYEQLEAQSIPLRNYLMKHVMPTLTQGLIDCCKVRPDDPLDYLAEFLFQHNPQVD